MRSTSRNIDIMFPAKHTDWADHRYSTITDAWPVETETGEFLYGLVRAVKPRRILELGTNIGYSAAAMGSALDANQYDLAPGQVAAPGKLITIDITDMGAAKTCTKLGIKSVEFIKANSLDYEPSGPFDLIFLDTLQELLEPELKRYEKWLEPNGWFLVHDSSIMPVKNNAIMTWLSHHPGWRRLRIPVARGLDIIFKGD